MENSRRARGVIYRFLVLLFLGVALAACGTVGTNAGAKKQNLAQIRTMMAIELLKQKNYRGAIAAVNEALAADSGYAYGWMVKGLVYQEITDYGAADGAYKKALTLNPESAEINNNYGWFLCDAKKDYRGSSAYFRRALSDLTYPTPELAYMNMGICEGRKGDFPAAEMNLGRAIRVNPNFPYPVVELARVKYQEGAYQEARQLFSDYLGQIGVPRAEDLVLGAHIARASGARAEETEYRNRLRRLYPYADETLGTDKRGY